MTCCECGKKVDYVIDEVSATDDWKDALCPECLKEWAKEIEL